MVAGKEGDFLGALAHEKIPFAGVFERHPSGCLSATRGPRDRRTGTDGIDRTLLVRPGCRRRLVSGLPHRPPDPLQVGGHLVVHPRPLRARRLAARHPPAADAGQGPAAAVVAHQRAARQLLGLQREERTR